MAITNDEFKAVLGRFASGVTVVTTKDADGKFHGLTVSAFSSVSMNPPLVLVCIHKNTGSYQSFVECKAFVVNILAESQKPLSNHFASHADDKFSDLKYELSDDGLPILADCLANMECKLKHSYDGGDHTIFVGEINVAIVKAEKPLIYWLGNYRTLEFGS